MSAGGLVAFVLLIGLLGPLALYTLVRSETEPERTDRASALRRARRDSPRQSANRTRPDAEWGAGTRTDQRGETDESDHEWGVEDASDDPWNR